METCIKEEVEQLGPLGGNWTIATEGAHVANVQLLCFMSFLSL